MGARPATGETDLRDYITHGREERWLEDKGPFQWSRRQAPLERARALRAILALANIPDGGVLVVGVEDDGGLTGLTEEQRRRWRQDDVQEAVNGYADPYVTVKASVLREDDSGLWFAVVEVSPFDDQPVVCKSDLQAPSASGGADEQVLQRGTIYTRPHLKQESVPVPDAVEMREILDRAVDRRAAREFERWAKRCVDAGLVLRAEPSAPDDDAAFAEERGRSDVAIAERESILDSIRNDGHWRFVAHPLRYQVSACGRQEGLIQLVQKHCVVLRGWDCPHYGPDAVAETGDGWVGMSTDWGVHREHWRLYQSGQFVHLASHEEDLWQQREGGGPIRPVLWVTSALFRLTEYLEFLSRLARGGVYDDGVRIDLRLTGTRWRELAYSEPRRGIASGYVCLDDGIELEPLIFSGQELRGAASEVALDLTTGVLEHFGWSPERRLLREDQQRLLERRLRA